MLSARKSIANFGMGVANVSKRVVQLGAVMATAAVAGVTVLTKRSMESIDAIAKMADRLGDTTKALVGLQHAGQITGITIEVMGKSLERLVRTIGEVRTGTSEAKETFEMLRLSADELATMQPSQAFVRVAEAISMLTTRADQAQASYRLFGRQGVALINTLMLGRKGLAGMAAEAEKLGLTFNRIDAAQVEAANDSITRLKSVITGLGRTLAVELSPFIQAASDRLVEMGTSGEGMGAMVVGSMEAVAKSVGVAADSVMWLQHAWRVFAKMHADWQQFQLGPEFLLREKDIQKLQEAKKISLALSESIGEYLIGPKASEQIAKVFADIRAEAQKTAEAVAAASRTRGAGFAMIDTEALKEQQAELESWRRQAEAVAIAVRTPLETYTARIDDLNNMLQKGGLQWEAYGRAVRDAREALEQTAGTTLTSAQSIRDWLKTAEQQFADFQEAVVKLWEKGPEAGGLNMAEMVAALKKKRAELMPEQQAAVTIPGLAAFESRFRQTAPGATSKSEQDAAETAKNTKAIAKSVKKLEPRIGSRREIPIVGLNV